MRQVTFIVLLVLVALLLQGQGVYRIQGKVEFPDGLAKSTSATLDFPSTTALTCSELTVSLAGAVDGDIVVLGVPNGSVTTLTGSYSAWVSASDVVTVRFCALVLANPASGTFKVGVLK